MTGSGFAMARPVVTNGAWFVQLLDQPLGVLARDIPGVTRVFRQFGFDFCCNGHEPLREAAARKGLAAEQVEQAIRAAQAAGNAQAVDWRHSDPVQLIAHIETRYHAEHRQQLPELIRLAERVERVHGARAECPHGLSAHLRAVEAELLQHMHKEERILFPLLSAGRLGTAQGPIGVMRDEHLQHGRDLETLNRLAHELQLPDDACNTWRALYIGLQQFREDLMEHIHLENNLLFEGVPLRGEVSHG